MSDGVMIEGNGRGRIKSERMTKLQRNILIDMKDNGTPFMDAYRRHATGHKAMELLWRMIWDGKVDLYIPASTIDELEQTNGI